MNKLNAIIIEDEVPAARLLHSMITRLRPQWTLTIIPGSVVMLSKQRTIQ